MRARQRDADTRLQDPVPPGHAAAGRIVFGVIEGMRDGPHQHARRARRKHGVGVERDDVATGAQHRGLADDAGEPLAAAAHEPVERAELAALALPSHPRALARVPQAGPVEEEEGVLRAWGIPCVERTHAGLRRGDDGRVVVARFGVRIGEVAQQREVQVRIAIGEILDLEMLERVLDRRNAVEQGGHDDRRSQRRRDPPRRIEVELRQAARGKEGGDELVDDGHRHVAHGNEREQQHERPRRQSVRGGRMLHERETHRRAGGDPAHEHGVGMAQDRAVKGLATRRAVGEGALELVTSRVDQVVADVGASRVVRARGLGVTREVDSSSRDDAFIGARTLGDALHRVPVAIACGEGHVRVAAGGVAPQHGFHHALVLHEGAPVGMRDGAQARDAVGHHQLRERQPLRGKCAGILGVQCFLTQPVLQPHERGVRSANRPQPLEQTGNERGGERGRRVDE